MNTWPALLLIVLAASGCGQDQTVTTPPGPAPPVVADDPLPPAPVFPTPPPPPAGMVPRVIDLGMCQIQVPVGAISDSSAFWSCASDSAVDADTRDLLAKNGIRVGSAAADDWPRFKKILDAAGAQTLPSRYLAAQATDQEISVSGELPEETLFYFDRHGLSGRVYDQCQNLLALSFGPSPAAARDVRLELCPLVRTTRRHYHYTILNGQTTEDYSADEHLYDLNLRVDLSPGRFIVIAPSPQSRRPMSIGHQFFTLDANSGRRETIYVFIVHPPPTVRPVAAKQP